MVNKARYVPWYRIAEEVLAGLVPKAMTDSAVEGLVSQNDWLIIPTPAESGRKQAIQRGDPNIYFALNGEIDLGLVCNTLRSINKMRNILTGFHSEEKGGLLKLLGGLDDNFETTVGKKVYEYHFLQSPDYVSVFRHTANTMTEGLFAKIFTDADAIHDEGLALAREGGEYRRLLPTVSLARVSFPPKKDLFTKNLQALKPLYEVALTIKTDTEIRKETARNPAGQRVSCPACGYGPVPEIVVKFCPECHSRMKPV